MDLLWNYPLARSFRNDGVYLHFEMNEDDAHFKKKIGFLLDLFWIYGAHSHMTKALFSE